MERGKESPAAFARWKLRHEEPPAAMGPEAPWNPPGQSAEGQGPSALWWDDEKRWPVLTASVLLKD